MRRFRWLVVSLLLLPGRLHAQNPLEYSISWEAVPGSGGYLVEVETQSHEPVLSRQVADNKVTFLLVPGSYVFRITTLNRFLRAQGTTDWTSFLVTAPSPPTLVSVVPDRLLTGRPQSVVIEATNLSKQAQVSVISPSGAAVAISADRPSKSTMLIKLPALNDSGAYTLTLTNPPDLSSTAQAFTVHYPEPIVQRLEPQQFPSGAVPPTLHLYGTNFSPEARVTLAGQGSPTVLPIVSQGEGDLVVSLPRSLAPGEYTLSVANAENEDSVIAPLLLVTAPAPPQQPAQMVQAAEPPEVPAAPSKPVRRNLLLSAAWNYLVPGPPWDDIYGPSPFGAEIGIGYYGNQGVSLAGTVLYWGVQASGSYDSYSSNTSNSALVASTLHMESVSLAPSLEVDIWVLRLRASLGGGSVFSDLQGENSSRTAQSVGSIDFFASGRLAADLPIWDFLMVETAVEYRRFFLTTPLDMFSAGVGVVVALGVP